jgi:hypothetical protein
MPKLGQPSPRRLKLAGQVFGRWTAIYRMEGRPCRWWCRCECGTERPVRQDLLMIGDATSCGKGACSDEFKHGHTVDGVPSLEYSSWANMKQRCLNPNNTSYEDYGGRGITICPQWIDSFEQFFSDMGERPSPEMSLDRINNNDGYHPGNCRWATDTQQAQNKRKYGTGAKGVLRPKGRANPYISRKKAAAEGIQPTRKVKVA